MFGSLTVNFGFGQAVFEERRIPIDPNEEVASKKMPISRQRIGFLSLISTEQMTFAKGHCYLLV
jgi:hypothetical protein